MHDTAPTEQRYMPEIVGSGAALFDFDGDGDLDAVLVQAGPVDPSARTSEHAGTRLFRNDLHPADVGGRVRLVDVTEESGLDVRGCGMGVAVGDYDDDGRPDLYITTFGHNQLWRNLGGGAFADVTASAGVEDSRWSTSATFLDYDRDGKLDLFVVSYVDFRIASNRRCHSPGGLPDYCGPQVYRGEPDRLFRNLGGGRFEDASGTASILHADGPGLGVVAADLDGDAWVDVYVANDQAPNALWMNQRDGTLRDEGLLSGTAVNGAGQSEAGMGIAAGDADGDGDLDLFVSHLDRQTNTLYTNLGGGLFEDRTERTGLAAPSYPVTGFGTALLDYDNDGDLDLAVANGAVFVIEALARQGDPWPFHQPDQLFENSGAGRFDDATSRAGAAFRESWASRGLAAGDVDNDGDPDLLVTAGNGPARLLINRVGQRARWIGLRLVRTSGRDDLGAVATLHLSDGRRLVRRAHTDGSYLSASDPRVLFGLGSDGEPRRLRVRWSDGLVETWPSPMPERYSTLVRGTGTPDGAS